jgi:ATP-dependent helicase/DNAse subunit B
MSLNTDSEKNALQSVELTIMHSIQKQLYTLPPGRQTPEYFDILRKVNEYLYKYCIHNIVDDLIDIDPDRSKEISYCTICGNTIHR